MDELQYNYNLLKAHNAQLLSQIKALEDIIAASKNAFLLYNLKDDTASFEGNWDNYFKGIRPEKWKNMDVLENAVDEKYREAFKKYLHSQEYEDNFAELSITIKNGRVSLESEFSILYDNDGEPWGKCIKFRDVTLLYEKNRELEKLAYYDPLTNIYNRNSFILKLSDWLEKARKENTVVSVANININDFRRINDGIGLMVGDELLSSFGYYLRDLMPGDENYLCAHINADMFCMAIYDPMGERTMDSLCARIKKDLTEKPFYLSGEQVYITVRIGVAEYPEAGSTALELFERAEIVMFKVSHGDELWVRYFDAVAIKDFVEGAKIEQTLKSIDFDKELLLYYQPQYSTRTGAMRGAEALIRWKNSQGKLVPPGVFIPVAERSRLIVDIGEWVLEHAVSKLEVWQKKYGTNITISINISALHFAKNNFVESVLDCLKRHGVAPQCLELELTETMVVDDFERITEKLRELKNHGIQAALDDFGTGYSSFAYLRSLPLNIIKIDKAFVDSMLEDDGGNILVGSIVDMMTRLGYETIAEGVEERKQYDLLKEMGCTYIQGYLLARPMPESDFEALLDEQVWD